jgi:hypothetical protein
MNRSARAAVAAAAVSAAALCGCASLPPVHGPSALAHSQCAPPNDAVPLNGAFVVCMNAPR